MKRVKLLSSLMLLASGGLFAQTVGVTVGLSEAGPVFYVDGQQYNIPTVFLWPVGSKHIIQFPFTVNSLNGNTLAYQAGSADTAEWSFGGWIDNLGLLATSASPVQTITVFPGLTSVIGTVAELMALAISFPPGTGSGGQMLIAVARPDHPSRPTAPPGPYGWGLVYVNGMCYSDSTVVFVAQGRLP